MKTKMIISTITLIVIAVLVFHFAVRKPQNTIIDTPNTSQQAEPEGKPAFKWSYHTFEEQEIPKTEIMLVATYENNVIINKVIDTIEGTCNDYPEPDKDTYAQSTMIICYYAGFGRYYKVIASDNHYTVLRKEFEEASPDYNPPVQTFQPVAMF